MMRHKACKKLSIVLCAICVLCSGCSELKDIFPTYEDLMATESDIVKKPIIDLSMIDELVVDKNAEKRKEKNKVYISQDIMDTIKNVKLVTEYDNNTIVDDMDSVLFGRCCQADNKSKDYIDWIVLYRDDEKALLLSKYILENISYSTSDADTTWDLSNVRKWLNDDFYVNAFSESEKEMILSPITYNRANTRWNTSGGTDTMDRIFLLSEEEVREYFYQEDMCSENKRLATRPTNYAKNKDNYIEKLWVTDNENLWFDGYCSYYLRSPGISMTEVSVVNQYGYLDTFGVKCRSFNYGIRPAIWVDINDIEKE